MAFDEEQKKCGAISLGGLLTIILSIGMIVIGVLALDLDSDDPVENGSCRIQIHIPIFLIFGGALLITTMLLRLAFQRLCRKCGDCSNSDMCSTATFLSKFSCILLYDILAFIVIIAWLVIGSNWTFSVWDDVDTDSEGSSNYCPAITYWFTVSVIILMWVCTLFSITCGLLAKFCSCFWDLLCCRPCNRNNEVQA